MDRWVSGVTNHLAVNMSPSIDGYWRELFLFLYIFLSDHVCKRSLFSFIFYRRLCAICFQRNCYNERENRRKITLKKESKQANKINRDLTDTSIKCVCNLVIPVIRNWWAQCMNVRGFDYDWNVTEFLGFVKYSFHS